MSFTKPELRKRSRTRQGTGPRKRRTLESEEGLGSSSPGRIMLSLRTTTSRNSSGGEEEHLWNGDDIGRCGCGRRDN